MARCATVGALLNLAVIVGCGGDDAAPPALECSDPLGGELHGVITPPGGSPITLGAVAETPEVVHLGPSSDMPSGTVFHIASNGVRFTVNISGQLTRTHASITGVADIVGEGSVTFVNRCPPRATNEPEGLSGTVTMTFNGERIDGWFNGFAIGNP